MVYVWADVLSGQISDDVAINALGNIVEVHDGLLAGGIVKGNNSRWRRTTPSTATTTIVGIIRINGIAVTSGRALDVRTSALVNSSTVANDDVEFHIRFRTGGVAAAVTDPVLPGAVVRGRFVSGTNSPIIPISALYVPAASTTLSLLLCVTRAGGTGSVSAYADSTYVIDMWTEDAGTAPTLAGTDI